MVGSAAGKAGTAVAVAPAVAVAARRMLLDATAVSVCALLEGAGVDVLLVKGPAIARWLYPAGGRAYRDVDLLVAPGSFGRAIEVLVAAGWADLKAGMPGVWRPWEEIALYRSPDLHVDLHRALAGVPADRAEALWATLWAGREPLALGTGVVQVPGTVGRALHLCLHPVQSHEEPKAVHDLEVALASLPGDVWQQAGDLATASGCLPAARAGLLLAGAAATPVLARFPAPAADGLLLETRIRIDGGLHEAREVARVWQEQGGVLAVLASVLGWCLPQRAGPTPADDRGHVVRRRDSLLAALRLVAAVLVCVRAARRGPRPRRRPRP